MTIEERMDKENDYINAFVKAFIDVEKSFDWDPSNLKVIVLDNNMFRIEGKDSEKFLEKVLENKISRYGYVTTEISINSLTDTLVQVFHTLTENLYSKETHLYQAIPTKKNGKLSWELIFKFEHK